MATTTISGSGVRNDSGTVFGGGNISGTKFGNLTQISNSSALSNRFTAVYPNWTNGVQSVLKGSAVSITAITQSGSTGYVNIQKSSHGLSVGDLIVVYGADVTSYNTTHRVVTVTDANNVKTDVLYTDDTSTHGSYKAFSGVFNKLVAGTYMGKIIGNTVAGVASSVLRIPSGDFHAQPYYPARGNYRYNITSWSYLTGAATKGANAGDAMTYIDPATGSSTGVEAYPTRAVPGEFVYNAGLKGGPVQADYSQKNG